MNSHSTNYINTLIQISEDSPAVSGEIPPLKGDRKTAANIQFEMISKNPYKYTSGDVLFEVYARKNDLTKAGHVAERKKFFSKGQPCFRASPLTKRYGWGCIVMPKVRSHFTGLKRKHTENYLKMVR